MPFAASLPTALPHASHCSLGAFSGSPAGYYFQPSSSTPPSNSWVIYLQGVRCCPVRCTV